MGSLLHVDGNGDIRIENSKCWVETYFAVSASNAGRFRPSSTWSLYGIHKVGCQLQESRETLVRRERRGRPPLSAAKTDLFC